MALAFRQIIDVSANVSIWFVNSVVVNNILSFLFLPASGGGAAVEQSSRQVVVKSELPDCRLQCLIQTLSIGGNADC